ncbi:MAG: long-chain fatty acid--CoA ligase [Chloroflexi bacterium]|jgi:long-chain acyl-CoA synthetase|nr:long-chain fatty acid--CoA ligase [Chloroflexota bacterium]
MGTKPWFEHYDEGVPHTLQPYPQSTLLTVVNETARQLPNHTALLFKGARLSYSELEQLSNSFAAALVSHGIKKGDRVALLMPNCPQSIIGQLGTWKAGAIAVPINPLYTEYELQHALTECGAEAILVLTPFYDKIKSIQPQTSLRLVIATNIKEYLPPHLRPLFSLFKEKKEGHRIKLKRGDLWLNDLLRQHAKEDHPNVPIDPSDPALLLFSGGTTGTPKAVIGTHHALLIAGMQIKTWFGSVLVDRDDVLMLLMPLFHVYGNIAVLATGIVGQNPLALVPNPRDLNDVLATIRKVRPAFLPGVPTLFLALIKHPDVQSGKVDFKSMKLCIAGAAPLLAETKNRFEALTGGRMVEGYALTESMMGAAISPACGTYKPGSVGVPLPDVDIRIADELTHQDDLPPGQVGEILIQAPQLMKGYWNQPEETDNILRNGWLYTGDLGYMDEDGFLFIVDREKDVIKPSGFQVWPREVEEVIASHPAVAEVCVAGVPDDYQGESVKAWVVLQEDQQANRDDIRACCREKLVAYKIPKHVEFRESLPKSTIGKLLRRELVADETKEPSSSDEKAM